jgi:hypothetical protein
MPRGRLSRYDSQPDSAGTQDCIRGGADVSRRAEDLLGSRSPSKLDGSKLAPPHGRSRRERVTRRNRGGTWPCASRPRVPWSCQGSAMVVGSAAAAQWQLEQALDRTWSEGGRILVSRAAPHGLCGLHSIPNRRTGPAAPRNAVGSLRRLPRDPAGALRSRAPTFDIGRPGREE